jgi:hypothetical protein
MFRPCKEIQLGTKYHPFLTSTSAFGSVFLVSIAVLGKGHCDKRCNDGDLELLPVIPIAQTPQ